MIAAFFVLALAADARTVGAFTDIDVTGEVDVVVDVDRNGDRSGAGRVAVDGDGAQAVSTDVDKGTLHVRGKDGAFGGKKSIRVSVQTATLRSISARGGARVRVNGIDEKALSVVAAGTADVRVAGQVGALSVRADKAARVDASGCKAQSADVDAKGAAQVRLRAATVKVVARGAARVRLAEKPKKIDKDVAPTASVDVDD